MACNENVIKNMANEITRNCQAQNVTVDPEFVIYLIELLLLNPKYGKLFSKTINRNNLAFFVDECGKMLMRGGTNMNTLKMQYIIQTNYDKLQTLIDKHLESISRCLRPLVTEILDEDPGEDEAELRKLFRKISIYIVLASGLGNPGVIATLKEGMAALESVFSLEDLKMFVALPRADKLSQLNELMEIVSGVRLFNRDCKKGGEGIPDLPFKLVEGGSACAGLLSRALLAAMRRVHALTAAAAAALAVSDDTGNVCVDVQPDLTLEDYKEVFELLAFNRQYEVFIRKLLSDVESLVDNGSACVDRAKAVLEELHAAVKYKAAVPVVAVFPLFTKLWRVWRAMQNVMYLISTVNKLMSTLAGIQDQVKTPHDILDKMLHGKEIITDQDRMNSIISTEERLSLGSLKNYCPQDNSYPGMTDRHIQFLGFCAVCLSVGALVPSNSRLGVIRHKAGRYGFCNIKMAAKFSRDPDRYVNEVLDYARNNPHVINLLNIVEDVFKVKDVDTLITKYVPKIKVMDRDIQTEAHPIDSYIEKNYTWDLWEWKRRACQWASIVKCQTHSTQTNYSHMRSEIQCQTVEPRDKCQQTLRDCAVNTVSNEAFLWGLRGQIGAGQHQMDLGEKHSPEKKKAQIFTRCTWPCEDPESQDVCTGVDEDSFD